MQAKEVFVKAPPLVGSRGQASCEENAFFETESAHSFEFF